MVRIHLRPLIEIRMFKRDEALRLESHAYASDICGSSSVDRASAFQAEGREFEPRLPL